MIADRLVVAVSVVGLFVLAVVSARDMGVKEGMARANRTLWEVPPKHSTCRVYPDGGKICRPWGVYPAIPEIEKRRIAAARKRAI